MIKIKELNHVALHVKDVEKSVAFYKDILELRPLPRPAFDFDGAWFQLGDEQELHLIEGRSQEVVSNYKGNHFALRVEDINAVEDLFLKKGLKYLPKKTRPDGAWQIFLQDPDGHFIEFTEIP
ncbi:VOC family protein [Fulvivirgaceae bacterium BMA10]|uniref:VOC family protein n=1 Tax=Splendidivirga corallicola TaxID=3051826 RepID=A0ABT8KXV5_9BACT|nr:VOC family protein [Fulvivirgaceae bacterium BMA10]